MRALVRSWSFSFRMVLVFSAVLAVIGMFMLAFFPARMASQDQRDAEGRSEEVARVMSTALAPAIEFDDPENAASILKWLTKTSDASFGIVRRPDGTILALWQPDEIPVHEYFDPCAGTDQHGPLIVVTTPVEQTGGSLRIGFSLERLARQHQTVMRTVAIAVVLVVLAGIFATMMLARMLGRIHSENQRELLRASRQAGMAEVATGILHNVGNVLTSVNVTVEQVRERIEELPLAKLRRLYELLSQAQSRGTFDATRLDAAVKFVAMVTDSLDKGRNAAFGDLTTLADHVDHIKRVVSMQNAYARLRSAAEPTRIGHVLSEACEMACPPHRRGDIAIEAHVDAALADTVMIDRHRILQIVVNLVGNARDAVLAQPGTHRISLHAERIAGRVRIAVTDSGVGIAPDLAARIFGAGVTSKKNGHGYGLHSSALAAREIGGSLTCTSEGVGKGATFVLEIPIERTRS